MKIGLVAPVKPSHPYLVDDPAPLLDLHYLRISPWLWFRPASAGPGCARSAPFSGPPSGRRRRRSRHPGHSRWPSGPEPRPDGSCPRRADPAVSAGRKTTSPALAGRFPDLQTVEAVMRTVLRNPGAQFDMVAPSPLLEAVNRALPADIRAWTGYWRERYGV